MPAERGVAHANVEPGNVDPADVVSPWELHQRVFLLRQITQVPRVFQVCLLLRANHFLARPPKARPKFTSGDVCSIFDPHARTHVVFNHVPVLLLEFSKVGVSDHGVARLNLARLGLQFCKSASFVVLYECLALGEVLQDLKSGR